MSAGRTIEQAAARGLGRLTEPLHQHRHRFRARDRGAGARTPGVWWGDDPHWFPGGTPPRLHNRATPLIDGAAYFAALHEALTGASSYVYVIGWCLTPEIALGRESAQAMLATRLADLLAETARRVPVRVLLWSGAPFLFQPTTKTMEAARRALMAGADVDLRCELDHSAHFSHCHHQKAIVVDGQVAFVGGMDLTTFQGDRRDHATHPLRAGINWHDVQVRLEGETVADVERNFRERWQAVTGDEALPHREPCVEPEWRTPVQVVRTIHRRTYDFAPDGEYGIRHAYVQMLRNARRLIYLENQYLWSPEIMDALLAAMNRSRAAPFRIVILLPAHAYDGKWDNDKHVARLRKVDGGRGIVSAYCPYAWGPRMGVKPFGYRPTYVHAKVTIVDDEWCSIGSANLNVRGLLTDSEILALMHDAGVARNLRIDLWSEHLGLPREQVAEIDPLALVDHQWPERAAENAAIITAGDRPLICAAHRYECGRMPGSWLLDQAEALTVEH